MARPRVKIAETRRQFRAAARKINTYVAKVGRRAFPRAIRMIGEEIMTDVKDSRPGHGVPVRDGVLRSSGRVIEVATASGKPSVELSFGDASAPYALMQHERLDFHHPVGEARYLVRGMQRWRAATSRAWAALKRAGQVK